MRGGFDSLAATTDFFILLISYLPCPVVRCGKDFSPKYKITKYMKTLSIMLLAATAVHAATTADATAFGVAFILFCRECGEDVLRIWNGWINEKGRA